MLTTSKTPRKRTNLAPAGPRKKTLLIGSRVLHKNQYIKRSGWAPRRLGLSDGTIFDFRLWREFVDSAPHAWVFHSEHGRTPVGRDKFWSLHIAPRLRPLGVDWANFQVMRRTASSLMDNLSVNAKLSADRLDHSVDINRKVYTESAVERRKAALDLLEQSVSVN